MFGFVTLSTNLTITQWSEYLTALTGIQPNEAVGRNLLVVFPDLKERGIDIAINHVLETGAPLSLSRILHRYIFSSRDGSITEQSALIHPLMQADQVIGVILNIQDVSDRSLVETELNNRLRLLEVLREIDTCTILGDLPAALKKVVDSVIALLNVAQAHLWLFNEHTFFRAFSPAESNNSCEFDSRLLDEELNRTRLPLRILQPRAYPMLPAEYGTSVFLAVPILEGDSYLGSLLVTSHSTAQIMGDALSVLQSLAGAAANAVVNHRIRQAQLLRVKELEVIHQISTALRTAKSRDDILQKAMEYTAKLMNADGGMILIPDDKLACFHVDKTYNMPPETDQMTMRYENSLAGQAFTSHLPVSVEAIDSLCPTMIGSSDDMQQYIHKFPAWMFIPIQMAASFVGVFAICASSLQQINNSDINLLDTILEIVQTAIQRVNNLDNALRRANQLAILNEISQQLARVVDLDETYTIVVNSLTQKYNYSLAVITEVDPTNNELVMNVIMGPEGLEARKNTRFPPGSGITGAVIQSRQSILANHCISDERYYPIQNFTAGSEICVPVWVDEKIVAALSIEEPRENAFDKSDQDAVEAIASHLGVALSNIWRYNQITQTEKRLKIIDTAMQQIMANPSLPEISQVLLDATSQLIPFERGGIFVVDENSSILRPVALRGPSVLLNQQNDQTLPWVTDGIFGLVHKNQQPIEVQDTRNDPRVVFFEGHTGSSLTCFPLVANGQVLAFIDFDAIPTDDEIRALLAAFYNRAATVLQNSRLYDETVALTQQRAALLDIATDLAASEDIETLPRKVLNSVYKTFGFDEVSLGWITEDGSSIKISANICTNDAVPIHEVGTRLSVNQCDLLQLVINGKKPAITSTLKKINLLSSELCSFYKGHKVQTVALAPIVLTGEVIGIIFGFQKQKSTRFDQNDLTLLQGIANQAAIALKRSNR